MYFITNNTTKLLELESIFGQLQRVRGTIVPVGDTEEDKCKDFIIKSIKQLGSKNVIGESSGIYLMDGTQITKYTEDLNGKTAVVKRVIGVPGTIYNVQYYGRIVPPRGDIISDWWDTILRPFGMKYTMAELLISERRRFNGSLQLTPFIIKSERNPREKCIAFVIFVMALCMATIAGKVNQMQPSP